MNICSARKLLTAIETKQMPMIVQDLTIIETSASHLKRSRMTYLVHFNHALRGGFLLIYLGVVSVIHAFIPYLFPRVTSEGVIRIFYQMILTSKNPDLQACVKKYDRRSKWMRAAWRPYTRTWSSVAQLLLNTRLCYSKCHSIIHTQTIPILLIFVSQL